MKKKILAAIVIVVATIVTITITNKPAIKKADTLSQDLSRPTDRIHRPSRTKNTPKRSAGIDNDITERDALIQAEYLQLTDSQRHHRDLIQKDKNALEVLYLTDELHLDKTQKKALENYIAEKYSILSEYGSVIDGKLEIDKLLPVLKEDYILNAMKAHLNDAQNKAFATDQKNKLARKIDYGVVNQLSELRSTVKPSQKQLMLIHEHLTDQALQEERNMSDARIIINHIITSNNISGTYSKPLSNDERTSIIQEQIEGLSSILNEEQLQEYRIQLEQNGPRKSLMTNQLPSNK